MTTLMSYLTGFGLASGAGAKAAIPLLAIGLFHYTEFFELSERFQWLASPPVLVVLGILAVAEILVDSVPELAEYSDLVAYLPKLAAGFIGFAAVTGTVDESLLQLTSSGVLGGATAVGVHWLRNSIRRPFRSFAEGIHDAVPRMASVSEAGASAVVSGAAVLVPPVSLFLVGAFAVGAVVLSRGVESRRVPCAHCGEPIKPGAVICPHCRERQ